MFSCDYNGWADVPEEEREGLAAFDAQPEAPADPASSLLHLVSGVPASSFPQRKAA